MPPKPKFTREEIVDAALILVSEEGIGHLTARDLAKRLGASAQPIFTVFSDMNELRGAVYAAASKRMKEYVGQSEHYTYSFKQAGMQAIKFAIEEPKLFQMLMMAEGAVPESFDKMFAKHGGDASSQQFGAEGEAPIGPLILPGSWLPSISDIFRFRVSRIEGYQTMREVRLYESVNQYSIVINTTDLIGW